jgi:hypothetical protein
VGEREREKEKGGAWISGMPQFSSGRRLKRLSYEGALPQTWAGNCRRLKMIDFFRNSLVSNASFFKKGPTFLKTEMNNPTSNFTWSKRQFMSIAQYQKQCIQMFYTSINPAQSSKTAVD